MKGMKAALLPNFEKFLVENKQFQDEFTSLRIACSELWVNADSGRDGVTPNFSLKGRGVSAIDKQHTEQITYAVL